MANIHALKAQRFVRYLFQGAVADGLLANVPLEEDETLVKISATLVSGKATLVPVYDAAYMGSLYCVPGVRVSKGFAQHMQDQHVLSLRVSDSLDNPTGLAIAIVTTRILA